MNMIEVKTAELSGPALDWAVAKAECFDVEIPARDVVWSKYGGCYSPSINWEQGGALVHEYRIAFALYPDLYFAALGHNEFSGTAMGETHLIAACRAIVAAKLGETVQVPAELLP